MPCYHPVPAFQSAPGVRVVLNPPIGTENLRLPCGTCLGCRQARATQWAHRCLHEAACHRFNCFVTLTYRDEDVPANGALDPREFQLFMKRLRKAASNGSKIVTDRGIRFLGCGEYGERLHRPHFHVALFDCRFLDLLRCAKDLYESPALAEVWPYGGHRIGEFREGAAAYIAKYTVKRGVVSDRMEVNPHTGELRPAPFLRMSLKPGIGHVWLESHLTSLRHGYLLVDGKQRGIPRAYVERLKKRLPAYAERVKCKVADFREPYIAGDAGKPERLLAAERIHEVREAQASLRRSDVDF